MSEPSSQQVPAGTTAAVVSPRLNRAVGGACLVAGAVVFGTVRLLHGDTPAADPEASLDFAYHRPVYAAVHLIAALAMLLTVTGLMALARLLVRPAAWLIGRSGLAAALVGWAVFTVESTSEGLALPVLADLASTGSPELRAQLAQTARAVAAATHGPSLVGLALMIGVPLLLFGMAMVLDGQHPSWLGWVGTVVGGLTLGTAVGLFLVPDLLPGFLLYGVLGSVLAQLWLAGLGVHLLLRDRA